MNRFAVRPEGCAIDTGLPPETLGFAELADRLAEVSTAQCRTRATSYDRASRDLTGLLDAVARVRENSELSGLLQRAGRELCGVAIFDRVMVSRVRGSTWFPELLYAVGTDGRVSVDVDESGAGVDSLEIALASPLVEAEVVRRRLPGLVRDAVHEPRAHRPLVERIGIREYVVAPIVACGVVIGMLHADAAVTERPLTELDRDLLRMFADGVGLVYERADLAERHELQRRAVADMAAAAARSLESMDGPTVPELIAAAAQPADAGAPAVVGRRPNVVAPRRDGARLARLTAREHEVLALLASGATNAQLADELTVAESTVKSHVKHILHKLGAGNRAAAIACYLRESRDERRPR